jgi:hypothetical protein
MNRTEMRHGVSRFGILLLALAGIALPASAFVLQAGNVQIGGPGETAPLVLTLDEVPAGLSGFNITLIVTDPTIAEITEVSYPGWAGIHGNSSLPSSGVWMKAVDLNDQVKPAAQDVPLGSVVLRGKTEGSCQISLIVEQMDDDSGNAITAAVQHGMVTVGSGSAPAGYLSESVPNAVAKEPSGGSGNVLFDLIDWIVAFVKDLLGMR